ncbi:competence protein ComE [Romeria aff. gracilis LEGE 07310]|uniref:phospholipase D n=1 Tax=Vasconcelosia minhoensis LEGE 07310 TaxID=915328 RepID=A0A8J7DD89_9CYAN|nr:competence protein ComE [Romeria aff. gracilis LEGE 07310]
MKKRSRRWRWSLCFIVGFLLLSLSSVWRLHSSIAEPTVPALPQDRHVQVFFNHSEANLYEEPYRHLKRYGDDLEQVIIDAIAQAHQSIDIAVHEINLPRVAQALVVQAQKGVAVRVIVENQYSTPWSLKDGRALPEGRDRSKYEDLVALADTNHNGRLSTSEIEQGDALLMLQRAQISLIDDTADGSKGSGLMHHKFMVIDQRRVIMGSANWTISDIHGDTLDPESRGNANALLTLESPDLANRYQTEFNLMWGDGPDGQKDSQFGLQKRHRGSETFLIPGSSLTVMFSPLSPTQPWQQSVNGLIASTLSRASRSIDLALFVFSDQGIANQLEAEVKTGVALRALIDPGFVYRSYSEALDLLGVTLPDHRCRIEANNHPWLAPITTVGSPKLPKGDKLHHKFAVIDDATVIIGSQNWSKAANTQNDENLLVIQNPTVAAHFKREFERLNRDAYTGLTPLLQSKIDRQKQACGL